jgi:shikimate kinase/3-dehydroquinate synthase
MHWSRTRSGERPALIGPGATKLLDAAPAGLRPGTRLFGLADQEAFAAAGELLPAVEGDGPIEVAGGEQSKSIETADSLLRELARTGVRRDDALCAFGGGVAGDLVGFCAAVYQRGIPVVQVPTTLVAQVDSAYGGKTGVDLPAGKNYVGAFHQPAAVLADPAALRTLPQAELAAGFAEVVKTALIAGGPLWEGVRAIERLDAETAAAFVFDCARAKLDVVAADERESG